jgi:hypothetical protein
LTEGDRIGYIKLNLADYIGQGLKTLTLQMDPTGQLFLTVNISVVENSGGLDLIE